MKFLKQQFILETQLIQCKVCKKAEDTNTLGYIINDPDSDYEADEYLIPLPEEINEMNFQDDSNEIESNQLEQENELVEENKGLEIYNLVKENVTFEEENNLVEGNIILEEENNLVEENNTQEINEIELEGERESLVEESDEEILSNEISLDMDGIPEIDIESLDTNQILSSEDKDNIKEELTNISSRKKILLSKRRNKINSVEKELEIKKQELLNLQREQEIFEDPKYEYSTDDELLDDEILIHQ
jgi:hypothetical protein